MGEVQRQHYVTQIVTDCFFPALQIWGQHQLYEGLGSNLTPPRAAEDPDTHPRVVFGFIDLSRNCNFV